MGVAGVGVGMTAAGATDVNVPVVSPVRAPQQAWVPTIAVRF
jgi:hypothetical protein